MKTAAVVIDAWKLGIFRKHLDAATLDYTEHTGIGPLDGCITLRVETETITDLQPIVQAAYDEAALARPKT